MHVSFSVILSWLSISRSLLYSTFSCLLLSKNNYAEVFLLFFFLHDSGLFVKLISASMILTFSFGHPVLPAHPSKRKIPCPHVTIPSFPGRLTERERLLTSCLLNTGAKHKIKLILKPDTA